MGLPRTSVSHNPPDGSLPLTAGGAKKKFKSKTRVNVKKWTQTVLDAGFTWVPNALLEKQRELELDPVDLNILLQFAAHWWKKDSPPFILKRTIAKRIGRDTSTVRRHIARLESRGFLKRVPRTGRNNNPLANAYSLEPLVEKLHQPAVALKKERDERRAARAGRAE